MEPSPLLAWCHFGAGNHLYFTDAAQRIYHCTPGSSAWFECSGASVAVRCWIDPPGDRREFCVPCKSAESAAQLQQRLHFAVVCGWQPDHDIMRLQDIRTHFFRGPSPTIDLAADMGKLAVDTV